MPFQLKVILDFEEEIGSPNLAQAVLDYKDHLAADQLIIFDGPKHPSDLPTIAYGARGITTLTLKVFGPQNQVGAGLIRATVIHNTGFQGGANYESVRQDQAV